MIQASQATDELFSAGLFEAYAGAFRSRVDAVSIIEAPTIPAFNQDP